MLKNLQSNDIKQYRMYFMLIAAGIINALILINTFDSYWWPQDDGIFAYLADRVNAGQIYGVDFYDIHAGYHTFLNAFLFQIFERDMVVMRYPLVGLGIIQAVMAAYMLRSQGSMVAVLASICITAIGFLQFPNASPNWYALFFAFSSVFLLCEFKSSHKRNFAIGMLIGLCIMFRHPSGIFLGFGVLAYFIYISASHNTKNKPSQILTNALLIVMLLCLVFYSYMVFEPFAFLMLGATPLLMIIIFMVSFKKNDQALITHVVPSGLGVVTAILPMVIYQAIWGDIGSWFHHSFLTGNSILDQDFFFQRQYLEYPVGYFMAFFERNFDVLTGIAALYWFTIFGIHLLFSYLCLRYLIKSLQTRAFDLPPIIFVSAFFAYVSFYYQIPVYYYISAGLCLIGFLSLTTASGIKKCALLVFLSFGALFLSDIPKFSLALPTQYQKSEIVNVRLDILPEQNETYNALIKEIEEHTSSEQSIYVFPLNPELYFLTNRKNDFPYYGSSFHIKSDNNYEDFYEQFEAFKPQVLIYNAQSKYVSEYDRRLFEQVTADKSYRQLSEHAGFKVMVHCGECEKQHTDTSNN